MSESTAHVTADLWRYVHRLDDAGRAKLLAYARDLAGPDPQTPVAGESMAAKFAPFFGVMSPEEARDMMAAIEEGCERVDADGW